MVNSLPCQILKHLLSQEELAHFIIFKKWSNFFLIEQTGAEQWVKYARMMISADAYSHV